MRPSRETKRTLTVVAVGLLAAAATVSWGIASGSAETIRDPADAARVAAVTTPTTDFSKPESYEANSAGAATAHDPLAKRRLDVAILLFDPALLPVRDPARRLLLPTAEANAWTALFEDVRLAMRQTRE